MVKKLGKRKRKALAKAKRQKGIRKKFSTEDIITKLLYIGQQLKEIAEEMTEEKKAKDIKDGIENVNKLNSLLNVTEMLDKRIDMLREDYDNLKSRVNRIDGRG